MFDNTRKIYPEFATFLRTLNRMNDTVASARVEGTITLDGEDIYAPSMDVVQLRARVGMVFQKPNPFPKSIYENIAYGPKIHGFAEGKDELDRTARQLQMGSGGVRRRPARARAPARSTSRRAQRGSRR